MPHSTTTTANQVPLSPRINAQLPRSKNLGSHLSPYLSEIYFVLVFTSLQPDLPDIRYRTLIGMLNIASQMAPRLVVHAAAPPLDSALQPGWAYQGCFEYVDQLLR